MFKRASTLPAGAAPEPWSQERLLVRLGLLLNSDTPATIVATGSVTSEDEWRPLPDGTGERQQQIVEALRTGI
jgi:hypothetical protein